jgi:phosphoribosylaminoimidazole-succinocarboxamide synthase
MIETLLYEGKAKKIFLSDKPDEVRIEYKDDATAFDGKKKDTISQKGRLNNQISSILFEILNKKGIPTHFVSLLSETESQTKRVEIIPVEVVMRNIVAGSLKKRTGKEEGYQLPTPILEWYYKSDELGDPMINEDHITCFEWASREELAEMRRLAREVNTILSEQLLSVNLILVDFKLEFGRYSHQGTSTILLADEISPDTCRLWDKNTMVKMDKDVFRFDTGDLKATYEAVYERVQQLK